MEKSAHKAHTPMNICIARFSLFEVPVREAIEQKMSVFWGTRLQKYKKNNTKALFFEKKCRLCVFFWAKRYDRQIMAFIWVLQDGLAHWCHLHKNVPLGYGMV